jgi:hypothetical protein
MDTKAFPSIGALDRATPRATNEGNAVLAPWAAWPMFGSGVWGVHVWRKRWTLYTVIVQRGDASNPCWMAVLPGAPGGDQDDAMHLSPQETPEKAFSLLLAEIDV